MNLKKLSKKLLYHSQEDVSKRKSTNYRFANYQTVKKYCVNAVCYLCKKKSHKYQLWNSFRKGEQKIQTLDTSCMTQIKLCFLTQKRTFLEISHAVITLFFSIFFVKMTQWFFLVSNFKLLLEDYCHTLFLLLW